jgi:hypothetical protein
VAVTDNDPAVLKWVAAIGALGGAATAVLFALLRFSYERFYEPFAITPEDVGIDSARVITQAAFALLATSVLSTAIVALLALSVRRLRTPRRILILSFAGAVLSLSILLARSWSDADDAAKCAARVDGQPARNIRVGFGSVNTTLVGIRAERATVDWLAPTPAPPGLEGSVAVFLGQADGTALIYLPVEKTTVRVPAGSVAVNIDAAAPRFNFRVGCQPPA